MDNIKYSYISKSGEILDFEDEIQFPDNLMGKEFYEYIVEKHPEHDIIFSTVNINCLYLRDVIYIGWKSVKIFQKFHQKNLQKHGIPHLYIHHPAARGKIRIIENYKQHVREQLEEVLVWKDTSTTFMVSCFYRYFHITRNFGLDIYLIVFIEND